MKRRNAAVFMSFILICAAALAEEHGVKQLDDAWEKAMVANDLNALVALYATDATLMPPDAMVLKGVAEVRKNYGAMFDMFTIKSARIEGSYMSSGDISVGWGVWKMTAVPKGGGDPIPMEGRATAVAKKINGKWLYVVDHASVPIVPE